MEKYKKSILLATIFILGFISVYLMMAFVKMNFDVSSYDEPTRFGILFYGFLIGLLSAAIVSVQMD